MNRAAIPVAPVKPELPPKLEEITNKGPEKDRMLRHRSATEIRADLRRVKPGTESARLPAATCRSRQPTLDRH